MKYYATKLHIIGLLLGFSALLFPAHAMAHVVVKPGQAATGAFETFTVGVPNEKDVPTTVIKVEIPGDLQYVTPTVKDGWTVQADKSGTGEAAKTTAITWSGGSIPAGYRDDFTFSAKVPDQTTELKWNASQTYADGITVAWNLSESDQPKKTDGSPDFTTSGPYSTTKVGDEGSAAGAGDPGAADDKSSTALTLAATSLLISLASLFFATRRVRAKAKK